MIQAQQGAERASQANQLLSQCETKRVLLDPRVLDRIVMISQDLPPREETKVLSFLDKNNNVFA
jgi:hypothetical protein